MNSVVLLAAWSVFLLGASIIGILGTRLMPRKTSKRFRVMRSHVANYYQRSSGYGDKNTCGDLPTNETLAIYIPNTFCSILYVAITTIMFGRAFIDRYSRYIYNAIRGLYLGKNDEMSMILANGAIVIVILVTAAMMLALIWFGTLSTTMSIQASCKEHGYIVRVQSQRGVYSIFYCIISSIASIVDKIQVKIRRSMRLARR